MGIKQMTEDPWIRAIPDKYIPGHIIKGKVAKLTNFGAFVELEEELEGLLHISELADHKIDKPQDIVKVDDEVEVKILKVDTDSRKIGLSLRRVKWAAEEEEADTSRQRAPSGPERVLSDADVVQLRKQKETPDESETADAEPDQQDQQPEAVAADEPQEKAAEDSSQPEPETTEESEQDQPEQVQENTDDESKTADDSGEEPDKSGQP